MVESTFFYHSLQRMQCNFKKIFHLEKHVNMGEKNIFFVAQSSCSDEYLLGNNDATFGALVLPSVYIEVSC